MNCGFVLLAWSQALSSKKKKKLQSRLSMAYQIFIVASLAHLLPHTLQTEPQEEEEEEEEEEETPV